MSKFLRIVSEDLSSSRIQRLSQESSETNNILASSINFKESEKDQNSRPEIP